ncbi:MAG: hypothetical protein F4163_04185 [Acidimicrobiaceae bacterium]|nr:hypothetical protein [Acidimicrobiaceae bacterium]
MIDEHMVKTVKAAFGINPAISQRNGMNPPDAVTIQDGPTGCRAVLVGGPEVADVIASMIGGDVPVKDRRTRTADLMGLSLPMVDAALAYYADHTEEIDTEIAARNQAASEAETAWRHRQTLLAE